MSPALAGGFLTTAPPGKPRSPTFFRKCLLSVYCPPGRGLDSRDTVEQEEDKALPWGSRTLELLWVLITPGKAPKWG